MPCFHNLRKSDLVWAPMFVLQWIMCLVLIAWLNYGASDSEFSMEWLTLQFKELGVARVLDGCADEAGDFASGETASTSAYCQTDLKNVSEAVLGAPAPARPPRAAPAAPQPALTSASRPQMTRGRSTSPRGRKTSSRRGTRCSRPSSRATVRRSPSSSSAALRGSCC